MRIVVLCVGLVACATAPAPSPPPPEPAATPPAAESKETVAPPATPPPEAAPPEEGQPPKGAADAEKVLQEGIALMLEMATVMQGVVDVKTAKAASPRLQELTHQAEALKIRLDILKDSVAPEQGEALKRKYEPQMTEAMNKLMQETTRVMQLPGVADVLRGMKRR